MGLQADQEADGYSYNVCAPNALVDVTCHPVQYCSKWNLHLAFSSPKGGIAPSSITDTCISYFLTVIITTKATYKRKGWGGVLEGQEPNIVGNSWQQMTYVGKNSWEHTSPTSSRNQKKQLGMVLLKPQTPPPVSTLFNLLSFLKQHYQMQTHYSTSEPMGDILIKTTTMLVTGKAFLIQFQLDFSDNAVFLMWLHVDSHNPGK